ncbi:DUF1549 and DUF1553 domain-containing protein [Planctomycetes bacterium K23_9]|uniref:Bacterial Ig-like domain (Group 2) n=1 Tax=Stieleria marina TaxID=1930275 RepID=A0A517P058_9BACT|nr:hypothetical protein K239x_47710 [Planctomycetes bacterium K23_9]
MFHRSLCRTVLSCARSLFVGAVVVTLPLCGLLINASSSAALEPTVSFANDVMPVLTKAGCNTGTCHAKAGGGQNGFELSLLGFEPLEDYEHLTREGKSRRLFPASPDRSLLLLKATGRVTHGGGVRLLIDSPEYATIRDWIQQGTPLAVDDEPSLQSVTVEPPDAKFAPNEVQSLRAFAHYDDGSTRDVTSLSLFESNDVGMATVDELGQVQADKVPGRFSVMVRYQGRAAVFAGSVPMDAVIEELPPVNNFVDQHVFENLRELGIPTSAIVDDATFLRRVTLDIAGRLPTQDETAAYLKSESETKRNELIDRLLGGAGYADYFANKWTTLLKNRRDAKSDLMSNFAFHAWIRDSLLENKPYDELVRELLAATGTVIANPATAWYKRVKDPKEQLEDVAQLFLGVRMQCAQCHHHPFERWSQDDYYGLAAFFSQVGRKPTSMPGENLVYHKRGVAGSINPRSRETIRPAALGDSVGQIGPDEDPRLRFANWMASPENPFFAKAVVNRYWKHFFKRGLIEPEDDIRDTNPPTNPALLSALEEHFVASGYDLKELVRTITRSTAYQLSSEPNRFNIADRQNYSRFYPRRVQAEVLLDSIDHLTGAETAFANLPAGTRAVALPDNSYNKSSPFLKVFGRPESTSVCECERVQSASLSQSLHLINASDIKSKLQVASGRVAKLAKAELPMEERIGELYAVAFSRPPSDAELTTAQAYLNESRQEKNGKPMSSVKAVQQNMQDLIWALINTKEFLFNH